MLKLTAFNPFTMTTRRMMDAAKEMRAEAGETDLGLPAAAAAAATVTAAAPPASIWGWDKCWSFNKDLLPLKEENWETGEAGEGSGKRRVAKEENNL